MADTVADTADAVLRAHYANPSSLYAPGAQSEFVLSGARETVAASLGAQPGEIVFTACGSEGNNLAVLGAVKARAAWADHIVVTGYEHPSVQNPVAALEKEGWRVTVVRPDASGHVDAGALVRAVGSKTALVTAMHVNNEVGSILDVAALAKAVKEKNSRTAVHIDGVQAWGKVPQRLNGTAIDSYAVSGHCMCAAATIWPPCFWAAGRNKSAVRAPKTWPISPPWPGLLNGCWRTEAAPGASRR